MGCISVMVFIFKDFFTFFLYHISARLPAHPPALPCIQPYYLLLLLTQAGWGAGAAVAFAVFLIM